MILDVHHPSKERGFTSRCCLESIIDQFHPITHPKTQSHSQAEVYCMIGQYGVHSSWRMIIPNVLNCKTPDNHRPPLLNISQLYINYISTFLWFKDVKSPTFCDAATASYASTFGAHLDLFPVLRICGRHFELQDIDELVDVACCLATRSLAPEDQTFREKISNRK